MFSRLGLAILAPLFLVSTASARTVQFPDVGVSVEVPDSWVTKKEDATMTYVAAPTKTSRVGLFHVSSSMAAATVDTLRLQILAEDDNATLDGPSTLSINGLNATRWTGHQAREGGFITEMVLTRIDGPSGSLLTFSSTTQIPGIEDGSSIEGIIASVRPAE